MTRTSATIMLVLTLLCRLLPAQETRIRVIDDSDQQPVPFCHICLEDRKTGNQEYHVADLNGEAVVQFEGDLILSITAMGYQNYMLETTSLPGILEVRMKPNYFDLDEVVVTGHHKPVSVDKSIYDIKVIGKSKIENQASNNMAELLSHELSFKIDNDPSTGSSLKLQGLSGENVKILVDGVPVIGRLDGNIDLSQLNLENVDHIEIVEGPMSVIYGSNALAGVVNIITKENKYATYRGGLHGYYESVGTYNLNGNLDARFGKHGITLTGGRNFFKGYSLSDTTRRMDWKPKEQYNGGLTYHYSKEGTDLKYKADYFLETLLDRSEAFPPYYEKGYDTWFTTRRMNHSIHLNHKASEASNATLLVAYSMYDRRKTDYLKNLTDLSRNLVDTDTTVFHAITARGAYNRILPDAHVDFQMGFDINTELGLGRRLKEGREFIGDYALFGSAQWQPVDPLTIQPGIRVSYNTGYKSPVSPSMNVKYQVKNTILRLSYARGFRAPSLKELHLYFYDSNHQIEGNEDLVAERSHNFNLTLNSNPEFNSRPVDIKAKLFYNIIQDKITLVQVDPDNPLHYRNVNTGFFESVGGDLRLGVYPFRFLSVDAGISTIGRKDSYYSSDAFILSTSAVSNATLYLFRSQASASLFYKYSGKYPVYYADGEDIALRYLDAYHNLDVSVSVKLFRQRIRLNTGIKNVFNNTRLTGLSSSTGHGGGDGVSSLVGWGRTFFLGINYNFTQFR